MGTWGGPRDTWEVARHDYNTAMLAHHLASDGKGKHVPPKEPVHINRVTAGEHLASQLQHRLHSILTALQHGVVRYGSPSSPFQDLGEGVAQDTMGAYFNKRIRLCLC